MADKVRVLLQPAQSPDLSPLDWWLWNDLKQQISEQATTARPHNASVRELRIAMAQVYDSFFEKRQTLIRELGETYYRRLRMVCQAGGGHFEDRRPDRR